MARKDMARSAWTRVLSKKQIVRGFVCGEREGKISLLKILQIREPFKRSYEGREVVLADAGYYWLQLAADRDRAWFTVMFDDKGRLVQIYVDVTDGNDAQAENPSFEDLYLDYVVYGGQVYELDRGELDAAFASGAISRAQYDSALAAGERIRGELSRNTDRIISFFTEQFETLRPELDGEA